MRATIRRLTALGWFLVLVAVPLVVLVRLTRAVLPSHMPDQAVLSQLVEQPVTLHTIGAAMLTAVWLIWAWVVYDTVVNLGRRLRRGRWLPRPHLPGPLQALSAATLGVYAVAGTATAATPHPPVGVTATDVATSHVVLGAAVTGAPALTRTTAPAKATAGLERPVWVVHRHDTLWHVAAVSLGDPLRWPEIYHLNQGRYDRHGRMRGGAHIEPGWTLALPAGAGVPDNRRPGSTSSRPPGSPPAGPATTPPDPGTAVPVPGGDDGVATPGPASTPTTANAAPSASQRPDRGVALPGGGWLDAGLAAAVLAAAALLWRRRSRHHTRRPVTGELPLDDPDLAPTPAVVGQIRRGLRYPNPTTAVHTDAHSGNLHHAEPHRDDPGRDEQDVPLADGDGDAPATTPADEPTAALVHPTTGGWPGAGLAVTGDGAGAAARGLIVAALTAAGPETTRPYGLVVTPSATTQALFGTATLPLDARLYVTADLPAALRVLEEATLYRSRLIAAADVDSVTDLPAAQRPAAPPLLLVTVTDPAHDMRLAALLTQGQSLDIHGLLLGPWRHGTTVEVADDGVTAHPHTSGHEGGTTTEVPARYSVLDAARAIELLELLEEAHPSTPLTATADNGPTAATAVTAIPGVEEPAPSAPRQPHPTGRTTTRPAADLDAQTSAAAVATRTEPQPEPRRVTIDVLGGVTIHQADTGRLLRGKARELLVYLAVHNGQASNDAILDDLLPDAPVSKAAGRLHTAVSDLRTHLRTAGGPATHLTHPGHRYTINPDTVTIDLWQMQAALREAAHATTTQQRQAALIRAVGYYRGPLADGYPYEWIDTHREAVRRAYTDAVLTLHDLYPGEPDRQLDLLQTAIGHSPYEEALYQHAMRAAAALRRHTTVAGLRDMVIGRMAELDTRPHPDTLTLATQLTAHHQPAPTDPPPQPRRADAPTAGGTR